MEQNLTTGSVFKNVLRFSLPYLLSYFLQTLYGMADLFIIGQYGAAAETTAVSVGSQVMHMLTVMLVGLAMGTTVNIAQAVGAGDRERASMCVGNTVTLFSAAALAMTLVLLQLRRQIAGLMSTPTEAMEGAVAYLTVCFIGIPFITAYNILSAVFRGMGDSKSPMYFIAAACAANIALDYLFIGAMKLGAAGAALGTTLAQALSVALALLTIRKKRLIPLRREDLRLRSAVLGSILRIGVPIAVQDGLIQVAFIIITIIANQRGLRDAAAVGIVEKVIGFLFLVPSSMLSTVSALGAQNIGAGKPERARRTLGYAIVLAAGFGVAAAAAMQFFAEPVVGLFTQDAAVVTAGGQYLRGYVFDCIFAGIHFCFSGYFCACGRSGLSFLHNITSIALLRVPGVWLMSRRYPQTLFPMGLATVAGSVLSVVICLIAYAALRRREKEQESMIARA